MSFHLNTDQIQKAATKHPIPTDVSFTYGTAGFRMRADILDGVVFRVGLLAALRSLYRRQAVGVMITASHNPVEDNGVKIVDPCGEMLVSTWETYAAQLANVKNGDETLELKRIMNEIHFDDYNNSKNNNNSNNNSNNTEPSLSPQVFIGRDTRPSSESLSSSLRDGLNAMNASIHDGGVLTTPQLHYMVYARNVLGMEHPSQHAYYDMLSSGYRLLVKNGDRQRRHIVIDAADGVGGVKAKEFAADPAIAECMDVTVINDGSGTPHLNDGCGAEFVQKQKKPPRNITQETLAKDQPVASFDGDADRIVYFYFTNNSNDNNNDESEFRLVDGDKEATLIAKFIKDQMAIIESQWSSDKEWCPSIGVVQTAYANGSSTQYLRDKIGVDVSTVPTGVKHLHHKALEYDVGIYFEANGHGTVIFSDNYKKQLQSLKGKISNEAADAVEILLALPQLINQSVGDALSDMLTLEGILHNLKWTVPQWNAMYQDLPSRMTKVKVQDRSIIQTTWNETQALKPEGLQDRIDQIVKQYSNARSFVRPSGTEDVVRVYAEASTENDANELAQKVSDAVYELAGGI